jgi:hypothetical protein
MLRPAFLVILLIAEFSIIFCGCASTGVVPMDKGTYLIGKRDAQVGFGPPVAAEADVYREASTFCAKQNKIVETIKIELTDSGFGRPASASLHFRCVSDGE